MDRLSAVKAKQQEGVEKKAAAEKDKAEKETKRGELSAEREKIAAEITSTESAAGEAESALQEVSAMESQGELESALKEIRAEISVLEGQDVPARVGRVDLEKMKADLEGVRPEDKQAWLKELKQEVARSEGVLKNAAALKAKHTEELQKSEPALRVAERTRHNAILNLNETGRKICERFASVL